jgi:hypothetical protein
VPPARAPRHLLAVLLAVATILFAVGASAERSATDEHAEAAPTTTARAEAETEEGAPGGAHAEAGERLLGIDLESTPLIALAVLTGLALSAVAASRIGRRREFLAAVAVVALAWAALDVREVLHQIDESREGIVVIAAVVAALHLVTPAVAGWAAGTRRRSL